MKTKRSSKKREDSSSEDSASDSSAPSRHSSPSPKKSRKASNKPHKQEPHDTKKKGKSEEEGPVEKSKWDSPQDHHQRRDKRIKERTEGRHDRNRRHSRQRDERGSREQDRRERSDNRDRREHSHDRSFDNRRDGRDFNPRFREDNRNRGRSGGYRNRRRHRSRSASIDNKDAKWGRNEDKPKTEKPKDKEKPNFSLSGKLTEETNTYRGVVIKYSEPPEARKPKRRWRLYPFKGEKALQTLYIHRESAYLVGRERKVVDLPVDHPSCSKQHAVLQYRLVPFTREDGSTGKRVRPYIIDLESANGTFINNKKIESKKYVELLEKDVIKFGFSSREYVLLHENSKDEAQDDDVKEEEVYEPVKKEKE